MLLASKIITQTLAGNLSDLAIVRNNWTELSVETDDGIKNYLDLDKNKELRDITGKLASLQYLVLKDLSLLKAQLEADFVKESKEIVKKMGYDKNLYRIQKGDWEALIQLISTFKKGISEGLKKQIVEKGTNIALIDRIIGYAYQLKEANITQETLKETCKTLSEEAVTVFNGIHEEIISVYKIVSNFYWYDELKREQFTFSNVVASMNAIRKIDEKNIE